MVTELAASHPDLPDDQVLIGGGIVGHRRIALVAARCGDGELAAGQGAILPDQPGIDVMVGRTMLVLPDHQEFPIGLIVGHVRRQPMLAALPGDAELATQRDAIGGPHAPAVDVPVVAVSPMMIFPYHHVLIGTAAVGHGGMDLIMLPGDDRRTRYRRQGDFQRIGQSIVASAVEAVDIDVPESCLVGRMYDLFGIRAGVVRRFNVALKRIV